MIRKPCKTHEFNDVKTYDSVNVYLFINCIGEVNDSNIQYNRVIHKQLGILLLTIYSK